MITWSGRVSCELGCLGIFWIPLLCWDISKLSLAYQDRSQDLFFPGFLTTRGQQHRPDATAWEEFSRHDTGKGSLQNLRLERVGKGVQHAEAEQGPRIGFPTHGGGVVCRCVHTALSVAGAGPKCITVNVPGHRASSLYLMSSCGDSGCLLFLN